MAKSLRDRQKELARSAILDALADEVVERGANNVSLQAVADRAGVSHRTLYNYFDGRDALIDALMIDVATAGLDDAPVPIGPESIPDMDLTTIPEAIRHFFRSWDGQGNRAKAAFQVEAARVSEGSTYANRIDRNIERLDHVVAEARPDLDPARRRAVVHVLRSMMSGRTWHRLVAEHGVDSAVAAEAAAWAFEELATALVAGRGPGVTPKAPPPSSS
ncbi:MAG: TetR/AcrR family transcriptional regulator [Acidimicrobiia bacterium]|nr:TetR/AcrR family transcriptional regulator [Acidimicrobiia bacterium]